jgi:hypothetical protein
MDSQFRRHVEQQASELRETWLASGRPLPRVVPSVTSGKILTPALNVTVAPAAPGINVGYQTGPGGLGALDAEYVSNSTGQRLLSYYTAPKGALTASSASITVRQPNGSGDGLYDGGALGLYAAPGTWTLVALTIVDQAGNFQTYNQSQLAPLFPSLTITVTNPLTPDTAAPVVSAGKILTPTVHLSSAYPVFEVNLTMSDNLSGVYLIFLCVLAPSSTAGHCSPNWPHVPALTGSVNAYVGLSGVPKGTWTIQSLSVCDVAGNCIDNDTPPEIMALFGTTTFTVAN